MGKQKTKDPPTESTPENTLADGHLDELMTGSGISRSVIEGRGYRTIATKAALKSLGFSPSQGGEGPWLFIPQYSPDADPDTPSGYLIKPHTPRTVGGKSLKYEAPKGSYPVMDVHPTVLPALQDTATPLYITEGTKKADAAMTHKLCALSLPGVWAWKMGGAPNEAWASIALRERKVYLAFDSDAAQKGRVWDALDALRAFLTKRGADVSVITLPILSEGNKTGLDDFLKGHKPAALLEYAGDMPPRPTDDTTDTTGLRYVVQGPDGPSEKVLSNFNAKIVADITNDDGLNQSTTFEIEARVGKRTARGTVSADDFLRMQWHLDVLGSDAYLESGNTVKDQARHAIQMASYGKLTRTVYTHFGWRNVARFGKPEWVYLHRGGAIGANGEDPSITVEVTDGVFPHLFLPPPPEPLTDPTLCPAAHALRASMDLIHDDWGVMPLTLYMGMWLAATMDDVPFGMWLVGNTGVGKTVLSALLQQHFGAGMDMRHLPANWSSTANALEYTGFIGKNVLITVDDFRTVGKHSQLQATADRLFRAQGNTSGRLRMNQNIEVREGKPVRGMFLSTAEDIPQGESLQARMLTIELEPHPRRFERMDRYQQLGEQGEYAMAMASYLRWLAPRRGRITEALQEQAKALRLTFTEGHLRTRELRAYIHAAFEEAFLPFAEYMGVLRDPDEIEILRLRLREESEGQASRHSQIVMGSTITATFQDLLLTAIDSGDWQIEGLTNNVMGRFLGWVQEEGAGTGQGRVFIHASLARQAAIQVALKTGVDFPWSATILHRALHRDGLLHPEGTIGTYVARYADRTYRTYCLPIGFLDAASGHKQEEIPTTTPTNDF